MQIQSEQEIPYRALNLEDMIQILQNGRSRLNILILDACWDNPFVQKSRSLKRGLAIVQNQPDNFLVAYATAPEQTAAESQGQGQHGLFTQELIKALQTPGLSIEQVFKRVRVNVKRLSHDQQIPEERSVLTEDFYLLGGPGRINPGQVFPVPTQSSSVVSESLNPPGNTPESRNSLGMSFQQIPAGRFQMGSPRQESGRQLDETEHEVTLTRSYLLQTSEVTVAQWQAVMGSLPAGLCRSGAYLVSMVSWQEVQSFIQHLNHRGEGQYRLTSEAEWEYAARSGGRHLPALGEMAWFEEN